MHIWTFWFQTVFLLISCMYRLARVADHLSTCLDAVSHHAHWPNNKQVLIDPSSFLLLSYFLLVASADCVGSEGCVSIGCCVKSSSEKKDYKWSSPPSCWVSMARQQCGIVAKVLDWELGEPGSSPHLAMETHWVTLGQSQTLSPTYLTGLLLWG